jgi:hypothetical protein
MGDCFLCAAQNLPRGRAYLLTQLRTGHNWLSTYAKTFGFRDNDKFPYSFLVQAAGSVLSSFLK